MPKKLIGRDATATLGVSLNTDATSLNNTVKLLSILRPGSDPSAARSAVIALERFFSERLCRGDLRGDAVESDAATAKYAEWFQKHYKLFTKRLCGLLAGTAPGAPRSRDGPSAADAKLQVLALAAVMECARSEHPGRFNNELYASALTAALRGDAFTPELLGALASRYLTKVDVRYHTYAVVARVADQIRRGGGDEAGAEASPSTADDHDRDEDASTGGRISPADLSRNLYDVLTKIPPVFEDYKRGAADAKTRRGSAGGGDANDEEDFEAMLGLMKSDGGDDGGVSGGGGEDDGAHGAWCKSEAVGEAAAKESARASAKGKAAARRAVAAASAAADAARREAEKTRDKWADGKRHRKLFADAWLALLRAPFPPDIYRKVLLGLHSRVVPHMPNPLLLSDFCTASIDRGGLDGMLALNGIFVLMTQHSLEYPQFYDRLYALLEPSAFHANNRKGFFDLLDIFLRSPALPAYLAAAFIKRLARLALRAPPAGAMACVAFVHNLLRRHPGCAVLVHREGKNGAPAPLFDEDPFVEDEDDPSECRALESSLWEMETLRSHYFPQVAKFTHVLDRDLSDRVKTAELPMGDVCAASYASLMAEELGARVKAAPLTFHRGGLTGMFASPLMRQCFGESFEWKSA